MTGCRLPLSLAFALATMVHAGPVMAQADQMHLARVAMANQVGAMEYCMGKGWADQAAVDAQKKAAASLPATADQAGLSQAEAMGRKGELMNGDTTVSLSAMARQANVSEQDLCGHMASSAKMVAAQQSSMPAFPGMPGGAAMPAMPPGMAMPPMSGMTMPSMPGMTKP